MCVHCVFWDRGSHAGLLVAMVLLREGPSYRVTILGEGRDTRYGDAERHVVPFRGVVVASFCIDFIEGAGFSNSVGFRG